MAGATGECGVADAASGVFQGRAQFWGHVQTVEQTRLRPATLETPLLHLLEGRMAYVTVKIYTIYSQSWSDWHILCERKI